MARVPFHLHVYPLRFPARTTLLLGGWSYTNGRGSYGVTAANRDQFIKHLQDHFVNSPWATASVLMHVRFNGPRSISLDTAELDRWLEEWPGAKRYNVFLSVGRTFHGFRIGTAEFDQAVGTWIHAWLKHLANRGIRPEQLALLLQDEPHEGKNIEPLIAWARALQRAAPEVVVWEDPTYTDPTKAPAELWQFTDVLCPNRVRWLQYKSRYEPFFKSLQARGRELELYSCSGPARLLDPYAYYRLQAWHCWQIGARGSFFWAFGDNSGQSSWREYALGRNAYTPVFLDQTSVTAAKQMEAIRESVEDYEYLLMLRNAVAKAEARGLDRKLIAKAKALLTSAPARVLASASAEAIYWHVPKDRSVADKARRNLLETLAQLHAKL
jgi:hypothetical protein